MRPFLLDWGEPGPEERGFDLDAYVVRRLEPALATVAMTVDQPVTLLGHCMAGPLAARRRRPQADVGLQNRDARRAVGL